MAELINNIVMNGASGKVGDTLVYYQMYGRTFVRAAPGPRTTPLTEKEIAWRARFQQAVVYGKHVIADPGLKEQYQEKAGDGVSAFNVAVADFLKAPCIEFLDFTLYNGYPGDLIGVRIRDNFKVERVHFTIRNSESTLIEEADANQEGALPNWLYTVLTSHYDLPCVSLVISAWDMPGNLTEEEEMLGSAL